MFDRLIKLIGENAFNEIQQKNILVLGCGGVGGYVIEALIRSGIKKISILDYDMVDETNLNRQIIALHSTIGMLKTDVIEKRILDINPDVIIKKLTQKLDIKSIDKLKLDNYDYIVDAIDDVEVKIELIKFSQKFNINLITSTGTAKKLHPELLSITTLDKTNGDPLAKKLRNKLKGYNLKKVKVLASTEAPITKGNTLASSAFVPSVGGIMIASFIINDIIKNTLV